MAGNGRYRFPRQLPLLPGSPHRPPAWPYFPLDAPLWGAAIDIGTTTVTVWLVDLLTGQVQQQVAEYNRQINRGEDVISRIIYASKNGGAEEMRDLVLATINDLLQRACQRASADHARYCAHHDNRKQHHDAPASGHSGRQHSHVTLCNGR